MKINVKFDVKKATKEFKERFEALKRDEAWKESAAELAIRKIVGETRLGREISDGESQKPLSPEWIQKRKELSKHNQTGVSYSANKSNLTLTGQLLKSLERKPNPTQVEIAPTGDRIPYKNKKGKAAKSTPTNAELTGYLSKKGRKFLGYDDKLAKQIKKMLKEHVRRFLL